MYRTGVYTLTGAWIKRKNQLFIFPSTTHLTKGTKATTTTTTTATATNSASSSSTTTPPLLSAIGQDVLTLSSSLAAKTIKQSIINSHRRPRK